MLPLLPAKVSALDKGILPPLPSAVVVRRAGSDEEMHSAVMLGEDRGCAFLQTRFRWPVETPLEVRSKEHRWLGVVCRNTARGDEYEVAVRLEQCVPLNLCLPHWR